PAQRAGGDRGRPSARAARAGGPPPVPGCRPARAGVAGPRTGRAAGGDAAPPVGHAHLPAARPLTLSFALNRIKRYFLRRVVLCGIDPAEQVTLRYTPSAARNRARD